MSSQIPARRLATRSRAATSQREEGSAASAVSSKDNGPSSSTGIAALRKRPALGDMTNAGRKGVYAGAGADEKGAKAKPPLTRVAPAASRARAAATATRATSTTSSTSTTASTAASRSRATRTNGTTQQTEEERAATRTAARRTIPAGTKSNATAVAASRRENSAPAQEQQASDRGHKRVKTETGERRVLGEVNRGNAIDSRGNSEEVNGLVHKEKVQVKSKPTKEAKVVERQPAKDEGWEDLDAEDHDDPLMVTEYVEEIFQYMKKLELEYLPNGDYMSSQREIDWNVRGVLIDWLIDIHGKFRLLPETLFLATNIVDRFLTHRTISLAKLQLVGLTAMFLAAKYEEVLCPSVKIFLQLANGGYTDEEILRAERYMLKVLKFNLSYANPMNFLRRISKADNYDIQTRTVAKYFMEISLVDHRFLEHPPSLVAAAAVWTARYVLERGDWTPTLVHYSTYSEQELLTTAELMVDYTLRPSNHASFAKKYSSKKFMRAASYVKDWGMRLWGSFETTECDGVGDASLIDLFAHVGVERPSKLCFGSTSSSDAAGSELGDEANRSAGFEAQLKNGAHEDDEEDEEEGLTDEEEEEEEEEEY